MSYGRRRTRSWAAALLGLALAGCASETGQAQEAAVVPSDRGVAEDRADKARVRGSEDAPIRLVEISDFQCPYCAQFYNETYAAVDSLFIQPGLISYVWISYANPQHPEAWSSIEASFCAGTVGKFWDMHDILFERQSEWGSALDPFATYLEYAVELGIDRESFADCMRNDRLAPLQTRDYANVVQSGINSTPYFILADSVAIRGAAPIETFRTAIDTLLVLKESGEQ